MQRHPASLDKVLELVWPALFSTPCLPHWGSLDAAYVPGRFVCAALDTQRQGSRRGAADFRGADLARAAAWGP